MGSTLLTLGVILILVGLIGRVKAKEIEVGTENLVVRIILAIIGIAFVVIAIQDEVPFLSFSSSTPTPTSTTTPISPTFTPTPITITPTSVFTLSATFTPTPTLTPPPILSVGSTMENSIDDAVYNFIPRGDSLNEFWIYQYEVTNRQFAIFLNAMGNQSEGDTTWLDAGEEAVRIHQSEGEWQVDYGYADHPVVEVTWYGADAYCKWAGGRLPSAAEWQQAAWGGLEGTLYSWGGKGPTCTFGAENGANYDSCGGQTVPVGSFAPNGYGLYDMTGNVWEWVEDNYRGIHKILLGGGWSSEVENLKIDFINYAQVYESQAAIGFRCVRTP